LSAREPARRQECPRYTLLGKIMTEKANKARVIGMLVGIAILIVALLWKRVLH
jgi:uncharacterized membrane protein